MASFGSLGVTANTTGFQRHKWFSKSSDSQNLAGSYEVISEQYTYNGINDGAYTYEEGEWDIEFYADGTYFESFDQGTDNWYGNWAYNEEDETVTTIDFRNESTYDGISEVEEFENGSLYFEGVTITVDGDTMTWTQTDSFDGDVETYEVIFKLK